MAWTPFTHRSTLTGTKDTGSDTLVAPAGQPAHSGWPGTTGPSLIVGTGVTAADAGGEPAADAGAGAAVDAAADAADDAVGAVAPPVDTLAHPAASAPAASSGATAAAVRRPAGPPARAIDEISVLMPVPRFCGHHLDDP
jgi:hypothetical protein